MAVALLAGVLCPPATQAASTPPPTVTISPLPGTPDATPSTQISFLGVAPSALSQIEVRGSHTGNHSGRLEAYSTGTGASYLPTHPFSVGEHVTVTALETANGTHQKISTSFTIARQYPVPYEAPSKKPAATPGAVLSFLSQPQLHPPAVTVTTPATDPALGDLFVSPKGGAAENGPMILGPTGQLIWFSPAPSGEESSDLQVQQYLGQTVLTYWQGRVALNHGIGEAVIDNTSYQPIATVHAGNGLSMDLHDFELGANGVAYFTVYDPVYTNLSSVGGSADGVIEDCVVQEVDVRTGLVMFEWHALGHVPLAASHWPVPHSAGTDWDWFHINTVFIEPNQNLLVNSRNTWALYEIDHANGRINWSLGGRYSSFELGPGVRFAWQHDATMLPDGTIQIFDNEDDPKVEDRSRGIDIALNYKSLTATLVHQYVNPSQSVLADSQGDVQQLPDGDHLLGWGAVGLVSELSPTGALTFEMSFPRDVTSYRAYRFPWTATPPAPPAIAATQASGGSTTQVAASWNGATGVVSWQVFAGASASTLTPVGALVPSSGFETTITAATTEPYVAVQALGAGGVVLATSATVTPTAARRQA